MAQRRIFYGWWIVLASVLGLGLGTMPLVMASFGIFMKPLIADFGWSRTEASAALTFHVAGIVLSAPLAGRLIDRFGARRLILISYPLCMAVLAAQYFLTSALAHLYASYFMIAVLGSGASPIAYTKVICNWFERRRGLALGLSLSGIGLGLAATSVFAQHVVSELGWRQAYVALAMLSLIVGLPVVYWLLKDHPSELGLTNDSGYRQQTPATSTAPAFGISPRQARRGVTFWMMVAGFGFIAIGYSGGVAHLIPLLTDRGLTAEAAAAVQASIGVMLVIGRLVTGYLLDYVWGPLIAAIAALATATGIGLLFLAPLGTMSYVGAALLGFAVGAEIDVMAVLVSRYFGTRYFASIFGQLNASFFLCSALGPAVVGLSYDLTRSYAPVAPAIIAALLISAIFFLFFKPYPKPADLAAAEASKNPHPV